MRIAALVLVMLTLPLPTWAKRGKSDQPNVPKPLLTDNPRTCSDQCTIISKVCTDPCKKTKKGAQVKNACTAQCDRLTLSCEESCQKTGRLEAEFVLDRMQPAKSARGGGKGGR